jgi:hypothetical protein
VQDFFRPQYPHQMYQLMAWRERPQARRKGHAAGGGLHTEAVANRGSPIGGLKTIGKPKETIGKIWKPAVLTKKK